MPNVIKRYVRIVDAVNRVVGRITMLMIFVMMGVLLWSAISKAFFTPATWTLEISQFLMVAYFLVGGAYSLQLGDHVRMDLAYDRWSPRRKAAVDAVTILMMIFFLVLLLYGGISSTSYAIEYGERARTLWRPYMAPIKIIMCIGIFLMLLQAIARLFRDIAEARGVPIE